MLCNDNSAGAQFAHYFRTAKSLLFRGEDPTPAAAATALCSRWGLQSGAMKTLHRFSVVLLVAGAIAGFLIHPLHALAPAATPEEQAVLAPITAMFDGMAKRDAAAIKRPLLAGGVMVLMRDGKPTQMTFDAFAEQVGKPGKAQIAERIHDPLVRIDNDLAVVWAPFEFLVDGKVDHCGTDLFNLVRTDGKWLIASIADTGRKDCH